MIEFCYRKIQGLESTPFGRLTPFSPRSNKILSIWRQTFWKIIIPKLYSSGGLPLRLIVRSPSWFLTTLTGFFENGAQSLGNANPTGNASVGLSSNTTRILRDFKSLSDQGTSRILVTLQERRKHNRSCESWRLGLSERVRRSSSISRLIRQDGRTSAAVSSLANNNDPFS